MSTSRTSSTPSSSLRPRTTRLISGLSDLGEGDTSPTRNSGSRSRSNPRSGANSTSRHSSRSNSTLGARRDDITSAQRAGISGTTGPGNEVSISSLWGTSWTAIQGLASDLLGEQTQQRSQSTHRRKPSNAKANNKLLERPLMRAWGPQVSSRTPSSGSIATGSREERDALVRVQKRKDLLSGASSTRSDSLGKYKRRTSDEGISSSAPPGANEDRDALVYLHRVQPKDTLAGITIRYGCQENVLRKANRMWPNDAVQVRKVLLLPVDACSTKGRPISEHEAELLHSSVEKPKPPVGPALGETDTNQRAESMASSACDRGPPSVISSSGARDPPWTHDSWVLLPNATSPTEIARLPRRTLGYFPPARRKSQSFSDWDTPSTSLDINRQTYSENLGSATAQAVSPPRSDAPQRPRRPRVSSNAMNGYFPSYLTGPGGVGTLGKDVRSPGPAQDSLNKLFAARLPNVAPPPNQQNLYLPEIPGYSDDPYRTSSPYLTGSGSITPTAAQGLENVGAAVEGWIRKMASKAQSAMDQQDTSVAGRMGATAGVGASSGAGDLIEMADGFEIGPDDDSADDGNEQRGRAPQSVSGEGTGRFVSEGVRARAKSSKAD